MSRYGIDYYQLGYYGPPALYYYSAGIFKANSVAVGQIDLSWNSPYGDWSKIKLTRNPFGFPVDPFDGTELDIANDGLYCAFKETDPTLYSDTTDLAENGFYYYSLFIFKNSDNKWVRAGNAIALSTGNYKYQTLLYDYLPNAYKISTLGDPFNNNNTNEDLYNFLSLFGFELNLTHTYTNLLVNRYDTQKVCGLLIPAFMQEFGLVHEPEIGFQQERTLLKNAAVIYKKRGTIDGVKEFIKSYSGYSIPSLSNAPNPPADGLSVGKNLMLDYNDSSFEESKRHWKSPDSSALLYCLKEKNVTKLSLTSNVATLTIGAHDYQVNNKVYISGSALPLFNATVSPVTITARTATTISFSLTGTDVAELNAYNNSAEQYPIVYPDPICWNEPSAPIGYPNKQKGILAVKNANSSSGTVLISCGSDSAVLKGVPVTAGDVYSFSIYAVGGSTARTITPKIEWYDRFGVLLSTSTGTAASDSTGQFSVRLKAENKTAPTGAYYAVPVLSIASSAGSASNEWHYFDCAQFEKAAAATSFEEARQLKIILKANRINELVNPHFNGVSSAPPWTVTGATQTISNAEIEVGATVYNVNYLTLASGIANLESTVTSDVVVGDVIYVKNVSGITDGAYTVTDWFPGSTSFSSYVVFNTGGMTTAARTAASGTFYKESNSLSLSATSTTVSVDSWDGSTTSQQCAIYYPSTDYTFSIYAKSSNSANTAVASITWYDISNVAISTVNGLSTPITYSPGSSNWSRVYVTGTAPSTAAYATVNITFTAVVGDTLLVDAGLFENSSFELPFFSGDNGFSIDSSRVWEGTANASRSHYYKNYEVVSNRLATGTLANEVPLGTTFALYYAQPNT